MNLKLISYHYPVVELHISSSKGTYIRSLAHDLGNKLGCFAHLKELRRVQSGSFSIDEAIPLSQLKLKPELIRQHLKT
jgi:tRNA pseudouridine55 synthase